jgi:hypothetical protein
LLQVVTELAPFLEEGHSRSFLAGTFPDAYEAAFIAPIFNKLGLTVHTSNQMAGFQLDGHVKTANILNEHILIKTFICISSSMF